MSCDINGASNHRRKNVAGINQLGVVRYYTLECLRDGKAHQVQEIAGYVTQRLKEKEYPELKADTTKICIAARMLMKKADSMVTQPERGYYQIGNSTKSYRRKAKDSKPKPQGKCYELLDGIMELQRKVERHVADTQCENVGAGEIKKAVLDSLDLAIDHYAAWLAAMDDWEIV